MAPDTVFFSFAIYEEKEVEYRIPVKSMGMSVDEDQYFELEVVEDSTTAEFGKHYEFGTLIIPKNEVEASRSFGATRLQLLYKVQLPLALPTILTGVNQTIMMSLSMVVIAAMIAAGGLGEIVLKGITQMKIGLGFEGGIAVVILAIILDRITQGMAGRKKKN